MSEADDDAGYLGDFLASWREEIRGGTQTSLVDCNGAFLTRRKARFKRETETLDWSHFGLSRITI